MSKFGPNVPLKKSDIIIGVGAFLLLALFIFQNPKVTVAYHFLLIPFLAIVNLVLFLPLLMMRQRFFKTRVGNVGWWAATVLVLVLSSALSDTPSASFSRLQLIFMIVLFALIVREWLSRVGPSVVTPVAMGIALAHLGFLLLTVQATTQAAGLRVTDHSWVPFHTHVRHLSYHGMIAACLATIVAGTQPRLRIPALALSAAAVGGLIFFGARGSLYAWIAFAVFAVAVSAGIRKRLCVQLLSTLLLASALSMSATSLGYTNPFHGSLNDRVSSVQSAVDTTGRVKIWEKALGGLADSPILGQGADGYRLTEWGTRGTVQPHNTVVQFLVEFGVLGCALIAALLYKSFYHPTLQLFSAGGSSHAAITSRLILACLGGIGVYSMVDGLLYHAIPMLLIAIILALYSVTVNEAGSTA
ncbi:MAG: O-antigen ligase family protein [Nitrospira sp.]|nr:O-antigen ligase family protein [Nitrospira sp.]